MNRKLNQEFFLEAALDIGYKLCRDAVWDGHRCNWVTIDKGLDERKKEFSFFRSLGGNFYDGTSGIALFLTNLHILSGEQLFLQVAIGALNQALSTRHKMEEYPPGILGFHVGWTGIAYTSIYIGDKTGKREFTDAGLEMISGLIGRKDTQYGMDVIDGIAGAIPALIKIYKLHPEGSIREFVVKLGDELIERAHKEPIGWSWDTVSQASRNLTGYAHGAAGMMHALFELYHFTGEQRFREAAYQAWNYERYFFSSKEKNWPDFRISEHSTQEVTYPCLWCHGAAGIGLSRVSSFQVTNDPAFKEEAYTAIKTTIENTAFGNSQSASSCHGVMGNLDLLLFSAMAFNDPALSATAEEIGVRGFEQHTKEGAPWVNGFHNTYQVPGFMLGLAGIGYQYLRLYDPEAFPSYLLMSPESSGKVQISVSNKLQESSQS